MFLQFVLCLSLLQRYVIVMSLNVLLSYFILDDKILMVPHGGSYYNHCSYRVSDRSSDDSNTRTL